MSHRPLASWDSDDNPWLKRPRADERFSQTPSPSVVRLADSSLTGYTSAVGGSPSTRSGAIAKRQISQKEGVDEVGAERDGSRKQIYVSLTSLPADLVSPDGREIEHPAGGHAVAEVVAGVLERRVAAFGAGVGECDGVDHAVGGVEEHDAVVAAAVDYAPGTKKEPTTTGTASKISGKKSLETHKKPSKPKKVGIRRILEELGPFVVEPRPPEEEALVVPHEGSHHRPRCRTTGKVCHKSEAKARAFAKRFDNSFRPYYCQECCEWHLTSAKKFSP